MLFEKSADAKIIESILLDCKVGVTVTYDELSKAIGRDVRKHALAALGTARQGVFKANKLVFGVETNVGLVRLTGEQIVASSSGKRNRITRISRKGLSELASVDFDLLDLETKREHVAASAAFGVVTMFANNSGAKKILSNVKADSKILSIGETIKLFS